MVPGTTITDSVLLELLVSREKYELNVAIASMIDKVLEVNPDLAERLTQMSASSLPYLRRDYAPSCNS